MRTSKSGSVVQRTAGWCEAVDTRIEKSPLSRSPNKVDGAGILPLQRSIVDGRWLSGRTLRQLGW